jgi:peroxiredoxin Q/BCP
MLKLAVVCAVLAVCGVAAAAVFGRGGEELKAGEPAPAFVLPGSDGKTHTLADLKGRTVVLAWFPKAFTGG